MKLFRQHCLLALALAAALLPATALFARQALRAPAAQTTGVPGVEQAMLEPGYWLARLKAPDALVLPASAIADQNLRLFDQDRSMHRIQALPQVLSGEKVRARIESISRRPEAVRYDEAGREISASVFDALVANLALDAVPASQQTRFGLVVRRSALRAFPTSLRVFSGPKDHDIDRFQESALFPGTPVAIAHRSGDGAWLFVASERYAAWIAADAVAEGPRAQVFGYVARAAGGRIVTAAKLRTVQSIEAPRVSELQLDMGVRLPLLPATAG